MCFGTVLARAWNFEKTWIKPLYFIYIQTGSIVLRTSAVLPIPSPCPYHGLYPFVPSSKRIRLRAAIPSRPRHIASFLLIPTSHSFDDKWPWTGGFFGGAVAGFRSRFWRHCRQSLSPPRIVLGLRRDWMGCCICHLKTDDWRIKIEPARGQLQINAAIHSMQTAAECVWEIFHWFEELFTTSVTPLNTLSWVRSNTSRQNDYWVLHTKKCSVVSTIFLHVRNFNWKTTNFSYM